MKSHGTLVVASTLMMLAFAACSSDPSTSAQFVPSATPPAAGLVKLVQKSHSGERVVVDAVLFGPEPTLDLFASRFGIRIGNPNIVKLVPQMSYMQSALVAADGQTIAISVDAHSDPSLVQVAVDKQGGGAGNGFTSNSVVLIELAFDVSGSGQSALTFVGVDGRPAEILDRTLTPIAGITFDADEAAVRGVTTGGGRY